MVKPEKAVRRNTLYIAVFTLILSVLMQSVFLITGFWDLTVLWGNLYGAAVAIGNFFLMGLTVQRAVTKEEKEARNLVRVSQMARMFGMLLLVLAAVIIDKYADVFHLLSIVIPLLFPRAAVAFFPFFQRKAKGKEDAEE